MDHFYVFFLELYRCGDYELSLHGKEQIASSIFNNVKYKINLQHMNVGCGLEQNEGE